MSCYLETWNTNGEPVKIEVSDELYQLCATGQTFLVQIEDAEGHKLPVEVSKPVYDLFQAGYRAREATQRNVKITWTNVS